MDQTRNVDASRFFVNEVLPRLQDRGLNVTYYIVGQNPTDQVQKMGEQPGVVVTGTVDDVRPFLERSAVVVAPYRMGSGVKHKIPIAFAMGKPVVGTPNACHGIEVTHERNVMIAESPASFADAIHDLLNSEEKRKNLGEHAQSFIREEYSWRAITEQLLSSIESLIEKENVPEARREI
jgi:glycosyltransferase involved in cell wall biosynthesis